MFGSTTLDIVIGLVLVYLLYSLFVTILGEIVSTQLQIRASFLRKAMERMLNDDVTDALQKEKEEMSRVVWVIVSIRDFIIRIFKGIVQLFTKVFIRGSPESKNTLADKFYNYPSMKYLASGKKNGLFRRRRSSPSYINNENFADTIVHMLREEQSGWNDRWRVEDSLKANTIEIEKETLSHILNLWADAKGDVEKFKRNLKTWFDSTMDRVTGWYKRRMQLVLFTIGFVIAMALNVDSIKIVRILSKDKDARDQLVKLGIAQANDSLRYAAAMKHDTSQSVQALDSAYTRVKNDIDDANKILALGWHFSELKKNDFIHLNSTPELEELFASLKEDSDLIKQNSDSLSLYTEQMKPHEDSLEYYVPALVTKADTLAEKKRSLAYNMFSYKKKAYAQLMRQHQKSLEDKVEEFDSIAQHSISSITKIVKVKDGFTVEGSVPYNIPQKMGYVIKETATSPSSLLGFIITALAVSLGSNFWFDLLKKLVSIRGAGVKPEEKEVKEEKKT